MSGAAGMGEQLAEKRAILARVRRVVVKVGSTILSDGQGIDQGRMRRLVDELCALRDRYEVILVSSGAVAAGMGRLGLSERPRTIPQKQAAAAVGQIGLMALYEEYFGLHGQPVAQVLLTHEDLANRARYINARHTFEALLRAAVVPIVNENDTVAVEEVLRNFGDNDNLSALVATLVSADLLVILSDVSGLHTANPQVDRNATLVPLVRSITPEIQSYVAVGAGRVGTGGMETKLVAAGKAVGAGIPVLIADGLHAGVLPALFDSDRELGTLLLPKGDRLKRRKHWIAHTLKPSGALTVDAGAYRAIVEQGRSLLPKGITEVRGKFSAGDCVSCSTAERGEFARGLVNYSAADLAKIQGLHTSAIETTLGYKVADEAIHRDDLVILG
jgi:glutamate 5-kinase